MTTTEATAEIAIMRQPTETGIRAVSVAGTLRSRREFMRRLGDAVRTRRRQLGYTQAQLADFAGTSQAVISRLEQAAGVGVPYLIVRTVMHALGLREDDLPMTPDDGRFEDTFQRYVTAYHHSSPVDRASLAQLVEAYARRTSRTLDAPRLGNDGTDMDRESDDGSRTAG